MICMEVVFLVFILPVVHWGSCTCKSMVFITFYNFSVIIFHIIGKLLETKIKIQAWKHPVKKRCVVYMGTKMRLTTDFLSGRQKTRMQWNDLFIVLGSWWQGQSTGRLYKLKTTFKRESLIQKSYGRTKGERICCQYACNRRNPK